MQTELVELGWTDEHLNRVYTAVSEEAHKARVAAQVLPMAGVDDPTANVVAGYALGNEPNPFGVPPATSQNRIDVDSDPTLFLTRIAVNVPVRARDAKDPNLSAVLTLFRRAANYVARIEDALVFNGRPGPNVPPPFGVAAIPLVYTVRGHGASEGLLPFAGAFGNRIQVPIPLGPGAPGDLVITAIIQATNALDNAGQLGPYACVLAPDLFEAICTPNANLVLPRDRILPFLQGPLLRSSAIGPNFGLVVALSANPVELVVASDIHVRFLQTSEEARLVFRVSERVAVRIKEESAIAVLF